MKIYTASSWRNQYYDNILSELHKEGYTIYNFRNPRPNDYGFAWKQIDPQWEKWTIPEYLKGLEAPLAVKGFESDFWGIETADVCVLILPCGRSAHLEAGFFVGHPRKKLIIYITETIEPELMYKMADSIVTNMTDLKTTLRHYEDKYFWDRP